MKIIHTADWHLGNVFHGHHRLGEYRHFLRWLLSMLKAEQADALIVAGDIFDSPNPSASAEELLYDFLHEATEEMPGLQIILIAGNHDSASRLEAPAALLKTHNIYVRGLIREVEGKDGTPDFDHYLLPLATRNSSEAVCVCMALPYLRGGDYPAGQTPAEGLRYYFTQMQQRFRKSDFKKLPLLAAAHFYAAGAEVCESEHSERLVIGGQDCVDASVIGDKVCYTALGHIHRAQQVKGGTHVWYAGSALPMSFSEQHYQHGVKCLTLDESGVAEVRTLPYTPLRRLQVISGQQGQGATPSEVKVAISLLPERPSEWNDTEVDNWPYLEIRLRETQPEPGLMHEVMQLLADRAVHFCRMVRLRPEEKSHEPSAWGKESGSETAYRPLAPLDLAQRIFEAKYNNPMSEELVQRFRQAEEAAQSLTE